MPAVEDELAVNSVGGESRGNRNSVVHAFAVFSFSSYRRVFRDPIR
jgi:hypothetical protein